MSSVSLRLICRRSATTTFHLSEMAASDFDHRRFSSFTVTLMLGFCYAWHSTVSSSLLVIWSLPTFIDSPELALRIRDGVLFILQVWTTRSVYHMLEMK
jgi:hypothetical protein